MSLAEEFWNNEVGYYTLKYKLFSSTYYDHTIHFNGTL